MESTGFPPTRTDAFPAGLRVLVVDDDPTWLRILEKMLKKCSYEVTTCGLAREALDLLRERKDGFDIVISDVNMPDMNGFKLLERVGLEMDLPVIMMSVDGETSRVMKGVQHGACDYLLKPIRMKELRNIWQHVFRKKIHEVKDIESHEVIEEIQMLRTVSDQSNDGSLFSGCDLSGKKRKDVENKHDDKDISDPSSMKKVRVVWTVDLHQKFVKAVNQIGFDKVGPKKILDLMNVPWLTRENVASHLQKYRLYLSRLQKDNDLKASCGGIKHSDVPPKDSAGNFCVQNSINLQQNDDANGNYGTSGNKKNLGQNVNPRIHEVDVKGAVSLPMTEPKKALTADIPAPQKASSSGMGLNNSFGPLEQDAEYAAFDHMPTKNTWSGEASEIQFTPEPKPHLQFENGFNHLALPEQQHYIHISSIQPAPSVSPRSLNLERDKPAVIETKAAVPKCRSRQIRHVGPIGRAIDHFSVQSESHVTNFQTFEPITSTTWSMKNHDLDQNSINDFESTQGSLVLGRGSVCESLDDDWCNCLLQGDCYSTNLGLQNQEFCDHDNPELIAEVPPYLYDTLRVDYDHPSDSMEYPVIDQGLFIT